MKYRNSDNSYYDYLSYQSYNDNYKNINPYLNSVKGTNPDNRIRSMELPVFTLYGYDDCEEEDRDFEYIRFMYPKTAKRVQREIDEECDKLEYDGSVMFDEYPDRTRLTLIVNDIYRRLKDLDDKGEDLEAENIEIARRGYDDDCQDGRCPHWPSKRPDNYGRENWLRDLVEIMLFNEIINRRRRRRNHRRIYY